MNRRWVVWMCLGAWWLATPGQGMAREVSDQEGVVSLRITVQGYDPGVPWQKTPEQVILGNALVVKKGLLLTTADLVKNATLVEVRKFGRYPDYEARVVLIDYELDLALLSVAADEFWKGLAPLPISTRPVSSGRFSINRWRANGRFEQGSGEVVELRVSTSRFGTLEFPELRATTAMGGLGWGEILTSRGRVIGIITSHNEQYFQAINSPLLELFIKAAQKKPYRGFAHRGFAWQELNHPALRAAHGLNGDDLGILVRRVYAGGTGSGVLKKGDILLKIGEYGINPEGTIFHPLYGQILFSIALNETLEEELPVQLIRGGKVQRLALKRRAFTQDDFRVHPYRFDRPLKYEIFGGLVLQELSLDYLRLWGGDWEKKAPSRLVMEYFLKQVREEGSKPQSVVVVTSVLQDPINLGYGESVNVIVVRVNGKKVDSLETFREAVASPSGKYQVIEMLPGLGRGTLIFRADEMENANLRVRKRYGIPLGGK